MRPSRPVRRLRIAFQLLGSVTVVMPNSGGCDDGGAADGSTSVVPGGRRR